MRPNLLLLLFWIVCLAFWSSTTTASTIINSEITAITDSVASSNSDAIDSANANANANANININNSRRKRRYAKRQWKKIRRRVAGFGAAGNGDGRSLRSRILSCLADVNKNYKKQQASSNASTTTTTTASTTTIAYDPLRMYLSCMGIVSVWITSGTLFYSYCNHWPLAQSFFYAVDAGMSIGFCTDVYEVKLVSKAFTIVYILLGASVIGGALALFIQDAVEGLSTPAIQEYQVLLEKKVFDKADISQTGVLTFDEFKALIVKSNSKRQQRINNKNSSKNGNSNSNNQIIVISDEDIQQLWNKFDRLKDGVIHFEEFVGTYRGIERLVGSLQRQNDLNLRGRLFWKIRLILQRAWHLENRIYVVFILWVAIGILWGMLDQHWDPITATHFAVSALATGGLTAPDVNPEDGILPARPAIFCGVYCLLGIPLFALTLGHFARVLVSGHVAALEASALTRPLSRAEFDLAKHLTTKDSVVHLSDFVVLQLLRQGKLSVESIQVLKQNFDLLDADKTGTLSLQQATMTFPTATTSNNSATSY